MMTRKHKNFLIRLVYVVIDAAIVYFSLYLACLLRQETVSFQVTGSAILFSALNPFRFIFLFWIFTLVFLNNSYGLYHTRREMLEGVEIWIVIKAVCISAVIVILALYAVKIHQFPRVIFILSITFMAILLSLWRIFKRMFVEYLVINGYNNMNILIVGAGKVGTTLAAEIRTRPALGLRIAGFLDDFKTGSVDGMPVLGKVSDFTRIVRQEFIHKVFITIHHDSQVFLRLLEEARELNIAVRVIPQGFEFITSELFKYNIGLVPILDYAENQSFRSQAGKRLFDFFVSLCVLIVLFPAFVLIAVLIKMDSPGPVFYPSRRYGRKGQIFHMLKFRSMTRGADQAIADLKHRNEVDGPIFKMKNDPRVTRIGRFLRRYSLDELPQFINVLKGEMSLVGPRPFPIEQIEKEDLRQLKRLEVRPGITGLWQIKGRSDISFSRLLKWDTWYINNWSFWLDLNIILQTVPVVLKCKGAY